MATPEVMDAVADLLREVSAEVIEPRFRALTSTEIWEKAPGELVTSADGEAEERLVEGLHRVLPEVPVVGEEGAAADPTLLRALSAAPAVWIVDPVDGTRNFASGSPDWAVMVALVLDGTITASWIWQPLARHMFRAELGGGAWVDGTRTSLGPRPPDVAQLHGSLSTTFVEPDVTTRLWAAASAFRQVGRTSGCAGVEYPAVATGQHDFTAFWRTHPWDHAPGSLLVTEAGGTSLRWDGSPYHPGDGGWGLLSVGGDEHQWRLVRDALLGPEVAARAPW